MSLSRESFSKVTTYNCWSRIFQEKRPDLDIAIIAPDIKDAHSINERVSIKSIEMTDKWLEEFLTKFYGES